MFMRARHHAAPLAAATVATNPERLVACATFAEFYPLYLAEHRNPISRRLHFTGSTLALVCLFFLVFTANPWWLLMAVVSGYAFAWIGHYFFEHNRPASFKRPVYSLMGDWVMWWQMLSGRLAL
jgi:hypothetical protein